MHPDVLHWVRRCLERIDPPVSVVELGSRDINGTVRSLFPDVAEYTGVDAVAGPCVDVVADAADYQHPTPVDAVVSTEMLEHCERAAEVPSAAAKYLRRGGVFIATMAGPGRGEHGAGGGGLPAGEWYRNIDPGELAMWLEAAGFDEFEVDQSGLDVRCFARKG